MVPGSGAWAFSAFLTVEVSFPVTETKYSTPTTYWRRDLFKLTVSVNSIDGELAPREKQHG